jgi:ankyrin repeat protein
MKYVPIHESFHPIYRYIKKIHVVDSMLIVYESVTYLPLSIHVQNGCSALHLASGKGHVEVVKCLLEKDASNINDKDKVRYISSIPSNR